MKNEKKQEERRRKNQNKRNPQETNPSRGAPRTTRARVRPRENREDHHLSMTGQIIIASVEVLYSLLTIRVSTR